jgi:microcystin-dependent protein
MNNATVGVTGGSLPHTNLMPSLCLTFIIAMYGIYPSQN